MSITGFRIGNYASFDGLLQRIESQIGLSNSGFLEPLEISVASFKLIGFSHHFESEDHLLYFFDTVDGDGINVIFRSETEYLIIEKKSGVEYPFLKWVHEIQNLITDKITSDSARPRFPANRIIIVE